MHEPYTNHAPDWARGLFIWRLNLPDDAAALERAAEGIAAVQNLLDGAVRSNVITSGAIGVDHSFQNWDGPWPYLGRPSWRIGHDWTNLARFMLAMRDRHGAWISFHTNLTDVNVGLASHPEMREFFEKLRDARAIYTRDGGSCGVLAPGTAYVPQRIPVETARMPYVQAGDPSDIFAIVDYRRFWDSGLARESIDGLFRHLPYPPPVLYVDVLSTTGNNLCVGVPDGLLGGSQASQESGRKAILDHIRSLGSEPGGEGPMDCTAYNWNHGGLSTNDYSRIQTGFAQGCCAYRGAEWQHVHGNFGAYSLDLSGKLLAQVVDYREVAGGGTIMAGVAAGGAAQPVAADDGTSARKFETDEWRTVAQVVEGFYLTAIQELYHIGLGNVRLPGGAGTERLDEHRGRLVLDRIDLHAADHRWLGGALAADGTVHEPAAVVADPAARDGRAVGGFDHALRAACRVEVAVPADGAGPGFVLVRYASPLGGTAEVEVDGEVLGEIAFPPTGRPGLYGQLAIPVTLRAGRTAVTLRKGSIHAMWSDGTQARWDRHGFRAWNGDVTFGVGYDRMWPDTWSGTTRILFYSRDGGERTWTLPAAWSGRTSATLHALGAQGRGEGRTVAIRDRRVVVALAPGQPAVLVP